MRADRVTVLTICRDCGETYPAGPDGLPRCLGCGSPRLVGHPELADLAIAHMDCDAFYASVEKRDNPAIRDQPVIIGGGRRGVVMAACYVARIYGVRSAMPMFKARELCPGAVIIRPDMTKYQEVGHQVQSLMRDATPLVEPLSIDEAFLDLNGTGRLHHGCPARTLALLALRIEREAGVTVSIGLSYNKFLAKTASDLDKPRGFAVLGRGDAVEFLAKRPVGTIWGVGRALQAKLAEDGIFLIGQLQRVEDAELVRRYGSIGHRLAGFARGMDDRPVEPDSPTKSISAETTFENDLVAGDELAAELWPLCERVAHRLRDNEYAGRTVTLKLKTSAFHGITRSVTLPAPTQLAEILYRTARPLLDREANGRKFRLIGIGVADLGGAADADPINLFDAETRRMVRVERAVEAVRSRLGTPSIGKGRGLLAAQKPIRKAPGEK
ncbi:MAG: DNA polymerase IV [Dongiaceae bacterium]